MSVPQNHSISPATGRRQPDFEDITCPRLDVQCGAQELRITSIGLDDDEILVLLHVSRRVGNPPLHAGAKSHSQTTPHILTGHGQRPSTAHAMSTRTMITLLNAFQELSTMSRRATTIPHRPRYLVCPKQWHGNAIARRTDYHDPDAQFTQLVLGKMRRSRPIR